MCVDVHIILSPNNLPNHSRVECSVKLITVGIGWLLIDSIFEITILNLAKISNMVLD